MNKRNILILSVATIIGLFVTLGTVFWVYSSGYNLIQKFAELNIKDSIVSEFVINPISNENKDIMSEESASNSLDKSNLSQAEIDGLLLMREEEKLARDVYLTLYDKWGLKPFKNISSSEERHTTSVAGILDMYGIPDPVTDDTVGVFVSPVLDQLYTDLVELGSKSVVDALVVGATIEDLDINDLERLLSETTNSEIIAVYENLQMGSRNHIRSFTKNLAKYGGSYEAQYISEKEYQSILSSSKESNGSGVSHKR